MYFEQYVIFWEHYTEERREGRRSVSRIDTHLSTLLYREYVYIYTHTPNNIFVEPSNPHDILYLYLNASELRIWRLTLYFTSTEGK